MLLTRLMRAGTGLMLSGRIGEIRTEAFEKGAGDELIEKKIPKHKKKTEEKAD